MQRNLPNSVGFNPRSILALLGLLLVMAGVGLLLYFAYLVYMIVEHPQDVQIFQYIVSLTEVKGPILEGRFIVPLEDGSGQNQNADFEVQMSKELKAIVFLFMGVFAVTLLVNIVRIITSAGTAMIKAAGPESGIRIQNGSSARDSSREEHLHHKRAVEDARQNRVSGRTNR